jgi:hypothetical protein
MNRALLVTLGLAAAGTPACAQTLQLGVHGGLGDYREVSSNLRYDGTGFGGSLTLHVGRFSAEGTVTRLSYDPHNGSAGLERFKSTQIDARFGVDVAGGLSAEVGLLRRGIDPAFAAQEMGAARVGVRYAKVIGPGATIGLRGNYLAGAKFTGAGSAGLAFELGLFASVGPQSGRFRGTAEYGFQRVDRKVGSAKVPIQQSLVRLGMAVGF